MKTISFFLLALLAAAADTGCVKGNCVDGNGRMIYADGSEYTGDWKDGK